MCDGVYQLVFLSPEVLSNETWRDRVPSSVCQKNVLAVWMIIDEFYQRCMSCDFGKQRNKITFRFGTKTLHILPDVFFLPFPRPLYPAHAHEEKYGWLARLENNMHNSV